MYRKYGARRNDVQKPDKIGSNNNGKISWPETGSDNPAVRIEFAGSTSRYTRSTVHKSGRDPACTCMYALYPAAAWYLFIHTRFTEYPSFEHVSGAGSIMPTRSRQLGSAYYGSTVHQRYLLRTYSAPG